MTIRDQLAPRSRKMVAWFAIPPPEEGIKAFEDRGFKVETCTAEKLRASDFMVGLSAIVFTQDAEKPSQIVQQLTEHAKRLLNYDCRIILRPASKKTPSTLEQTTEFEITDFTSIIASAISELHLPASLPAQEAEKLKDWPFNGDPPFPYAKVFQIGALWSDIANFVLENPPGNAPRDQPYLLIDIKDKFGNDICFDDTYPPDVPPYKNLPAGLKNNNKKGNKLNHGSELLLRRAFWDCKEVHLVAMADGLSGVPVFRAFPELERGQAGQGARGTRPYFVKIGDRKDIFEEYKNYVDYVRPYVPFHLGPHLILERCCLGADQGVIVGDLVDESESLRSCACDGRAAIAIACLFNRTLYGWHSRFESDQRSLVEIKDYRGKEYFPISIPDERLDCAINLGAKKTLDQLRDLFECCSELKPVLVAPIHGDLHGANVLVRGSDAIVIDFLSHYNGPLLYDAASLEAGLLVDGFTNDKRDPKEWLDTLLPLYDEDSLFGINAYIHPKNPSAWFYECVRQIRLHAR